MPTLEQAENWFKNEHSNTRTKHYLGVGQFAGRSTTVIFTHYVGSRVELMEDATGTWVRVFGISPETGLNIYGPAIGEGGETK